MKLDHIAIVVRNMDEAVATYTQKLGLSLSSRQQVESEKVEIAVLSADNAHIELVRPLEETSGVAKFLAKKGEGLHHICLEVDDLDTLIQSLQASGIGLIDTKPHTGYKGNRAVFLRPSSAHGVLIEFYEKQGATAPGSKH